MELKEISVSAETISTTAAFLKPVTVIASAVSKEYLKELELTEYCKVAESTLKDYENAIRRIITSKIESLRVQADYKIRNQINATNSDSLLHAKNELYKYKCELKSSYVAAEKSLKAKELRYTQIISSYDSNWQKALKKLNSSPEFLDLARAKEENALLERKIEKQQQVNITTEKQFTELRECIQEQFLKKVIEFSKAMTQYKKFLDSVKHNKEIAPTKTNKNWMKNLGFTLFEETPPVVEKKSPEPTSPEDLNGSSPIDISVFDDVLIPSESLESQHLEEDVYSTSQNKDQSSDGSKDQEENLETYNKPEQDPRNKTCEENEKRWNSMEINTGAEDENESHYFRLNMTEGSKKAKIAEDDHQKSKQSRAELDVSRKSEDNEEDIQKERQMECDKSLSGGSSENQFSIQKNIYDYQYAKGTSFSSDDFPSAADNVDELLQKSDEEEGTNLFKLGQPDKRDSEPMSGFFTFGSEHNSSKPAIFKLF